MSGNRGNSAPMQRYDKMTDAEIDKLMLPLDRDAAIRKMLSPDWQKKKPRKQVEVSCTKCGKPRMVNVSDRKPLLCAPCSRKVSGFNGGSRQ